MTLMQSEIQKEKSNLAHAFFVFGCASAFFYVAQRLYEYVLHGPPMNPSLILAQEHISYFWRSITAAWLGVLVAFLYFQWRKNTPKEKTSNPQNLGITLYISLTILFVILVWIFP